MTARIRGSSPRMRGKRLFADDGPLSPGLIPAYAGKTLDTVPDFGNTGLIPAYAGKTSSV